MGEKRKRKRKRDRERERSQSYGSNLSWLARGVERYAASFIVKSGLAVQLHDGLWSRDDLIPSSVVRVPWSTIIQSVTTIR